MRRVYLTELLFQPASTLLKTATPLLFAQSQCAPVSTVITMVKRAIATAKYNRFSAGVTLKQQKEC